MRFRIRIRLFIWMTIMTQREKQKLLGANATIWSVAILAAFILPLIAAFMADGPARFLQVLCFAGPLIAGMLTSTSLISRAIGQPTD